MWVAPKAVVVRSGSSEARANTASWRRHLPSQLNRSCFEPQERQTRLNSERIDVAEYRGLDVDFGPQPVHDRGGVRITATPPITDGGGEPQRQPVVP
jgi:hypothetical protein